MDDQGIQLLERPRVEQSLDPLARRQAALGVLALDRRRTTAQAQPLLVRHQFVDEVPEPVTNGDSPQ